MDNMRELKIELNKIYEEINKKFYEQRKALKPCPFCGDTPTIDIYTDDYGFWASSIRCSNCDYLMKDIRNQCETPIEARLNSPYLITKWNTRVKLKEE